MVVDWCQGFFATMESVLEFATGTRALESALQLSDTSESVLLETYRSYESTKETCIDTVVEKGHPRECERSRARFEKNPTLWRGERATRSTSSTHSGAARSAATA